MKRMYIHIVSTHTYVFIILNPNKVNFCCLIKDGVRSVLVDRKSDSSMGEAGRVVEKKMIELIDISSILIKVSVE